VPPEKRIKPKRRLMVLLASISGFFISVALAFFMEYLEGALSKPEYMEKVAKLKRTMSFR
jgi:tyrosine-protein kinase Etk/Wzc